MLTTLSENEKSRGAKEHCRKAQPPDRFVAALKEIRRGPCLHPCNHDGWTVQHLHSLPECEQELELTLRLIHLGKLDMDKLSAQRKNDAAEITRLM